MRQNVVDSFSLCTWIAFSLLYDAVIYIHIISYLEREFRVKHFQYCTTSIHKRNMKYAVRLAHILKYGTLPRTVSECLWLSTAAVEAVMNIY